MYNMPKIISFHFWLKFFNLVTGQFDRIKIHQNDCKQVISHDLFDGFHSKVIYQKCVLLTNIGNDYSLKDFSQKILKKISFSSASLWIKQIYVDGFIFRKASTCLSHLKGIKFRDLWSFLWNFIPPWSFKITQWRN